MAGKGNAPGSPNTKHLKRGNIFDPIKAGYHRWDIRKAQRHMAALEIDLTDPKALQKFFGRRKPTIAEAIALRQLTKAISGGDRAIESVTDNLCGKLEQPLRHGNDPLHPLTPTKPVEIPKTTDPKEAKRILDEIMKE